MAKFCTNCGNQLDEEGKCPNCGYTLKTDTNVAQSVKSVTDKVTEKINQMAGEEGGVNLKVNDLFVEVFKRHSVEESEEIFTSGTSKTTPPENEITTTWPKPWLYSRVLVMFLITFALLYMCFNTFSNINALPGMIFIGAITIPFSLIVFFVEVNAPRNISFFEVIKIFFMGGGASLLVALVLYSFISSTDGYFGAVLVGAVEEMAKLVVICFFISKIKNAKYLLNGLLIGAVVGAGFATFETAGYILNWGMNLGTDAMMHVLFLRAVLAPGGHVVWGAILGGAVILVKKERPFQMAQLLDTQFLSFAALCVAMHAVWDMPINIGGSWPVVQLGLTVAAWIVVLVLISVGLKQISRKVNNYQINQPENVEINA